MFGVSSRWLDYDDCDLPALGSYEVAADHVGHDMIHFLSQMYKNWELFHAADVKSKMREAERFQGAPKQDVVFTQCDWVYYYHEPPKQGIVSWKGPAVVVGVDAGMVLVKHGGGVKRLPTIAVRHEASVVGDRPDPELEGDVAENPSQEAPDVEGAHTRIVLPDVSENKRFVVPSVHVDDSLDVGPEDCDEAGNVITRDEVHVNGVPDYLASVAHGKPLNMHGFVEAARRSVVRVTELSKQLRKQGATVPQIVNTFCADSQDELVLFASFLANMALKRKKSHGEVSAARAAELDFLEAKQRELASWGRCGVYELVPDCGQAVVTTRWVKTEKILGDGTVTPKSRLVARRFQEADKDSLDTASPTVDRGVWRVMVAMTAVYGWVPYCFDISTAFLQGRQITCDVSLCPPPEIGEPGMVMKLSKSVYGLVDAPLQWYEALNEGIVAIGGVRLPYDKCAWMWYADDSSLLALLCAHVDDQYSSADLSFEESLLVKLRALFPVGKEKTGDFIYCGLQVSTELHDNGQLTSISVDQRTYIDKIVPMEISHTTGSQDSCLEQQEHSDYR